MKAVFEALVEYHFIFIISLLVVVVFKGSYFELRHNKKSEDLDSSSRWLLKQTLHVGASQLLAMSMFLIWDWYAAQSTYPDFWTFPWPYILLMITWDLCTLFGLLVSFAPVFWTRNKILKEIENEEVIRRREFNPRKRLFFFSWR